MRHPRRRRRLLDGQRPEREDPDPFADPARPVPNLLAADRFEYFYRAMGLVEGQREWGQFISTLHKPLPVSFRISTAATLAPECLACGAPLLRGTGALPAATELRWCSSWIVGVSKEVLKASREPELQAMQDWLTKFGSLGVLTRQAIESMVPVALLRVQPHHAVLDMCASPGSKTTQAVEALYAPDEGIPCSGFMVANDMSPTRCQMLLRRCAALGDMCSRVLVTCHPAQRFPRLDTSGDGGGGGGGGDRAASAAKAHVGEGSFDRIICDVPCSGDGTTRKNPSVWHRWSVEYALGMHPLQLQIALRGVALLKVGGMMAYSTCSLNPLENESVVAELLHRPEGRSSSWMPRVI
jgi:16S rRNA C967 or C1407 C5-methylase (RsmB/RsmF family)